MSAYTQVYPQGTPSTEYLGAGAIYTGGDSDPDNWGTTPPSLFGTVTKGGSTFNDNIETRMREADSDYMPVKGAIDVTGFNPQLTINSLAISTANLVKLYGGMETTAGTSFDEVVRTIDLTYNTDSFWWVGKNRSGDDMVIRLDNVIGLAPFTINPTKDEEIVISPVLTATADPETFDPTDSSTYPWAIYIES